MNEIQILFYCFFFWKILNFMIECFENKKFHARELNFPDI